MSINIEPKKQLREIFKALEEEKRKKTRYHRSK